MSDVRRDRQKEEEFFHKSKPPELPIDIIRKLQVHLDPDGDLVFLCENSQRRYALCVVLADHTHLGWKECQAIGDVMKITSRGTEIDNPLFIRLTNQLKDTYGKVQDPNVQNGRLTAVVYPGQGTVRENEPHTIRYTSISFDTDGDLVFSATTNHNHVYRVCLELTLSDNRFLNLDCKAFIDVLTMLEAGDKLSPPQFFASGAVLREKYNYVTPSTSNSGHTLTMTVLASRVPNTQTIPSLFTEAMRKVNNANNVPPPIIRSHQSDAPAHHQRHHPPHTGPPCPYPGIVYINAIKEGGQGQVYAGRRASGDRVAIKVFLDQEGACEAYKTELRMLLKMSRHSNVVEVLDFFETPAPALVMKLIEGEDLMDYLRAQGACPEDEGRKLAIGIAEGLCHLHRHGIIHRDFKSANILRQRDGTPVIIDLGLGSVIDRKVKRKQGSSITNPDIFRTVSTTHISERTSTIRGSFPWMAPEMITDMEWSDKTDVYAFGIIMWEIFSGQTPFVRQGEEVNPMNLLWRIIHGERPPMEAVSHVSSELRQLMELCWHGTPRNRPKMKRVLDILHGNDPRRIFKVLDGNDSGGLDFGEFVMFLQRYAPGRVQVPQMADLFTTIDEDKSGEIGIDEFERFWREVEASGIRNVVHNSRRKKVG